MGTDMECNLMVWDCFSVLYFGFISVHETACNLYLNDSKTSPLQDFMTSWLNTFAVHTFSCRKEDKPPLPAARINVPLEISVTTTLPRFGKVPPAIGRLGRPSDRRRRLILILEAASRTFDALESGLSAGTVEKTFKPMSATCGWSRKLGKQEQTLRNQLEYLSGGGGNSSDSSDSSDSKEGEEVAVGRGQGAGERRSPRRRDDDLVLAAEAMAKGRGAEEADVARWEEEVVQFAREFGKGVDKT
ncbi:hypothetical protein K4K48_004426 [Colletotrichum sp. SAR 10_66]|nr:hypothetical protein K4K48_004426 [Colletotrichum sp. SAR 10_66]